MITQAEALSLFSYESSTGDIHWKIRRQGTRTGEPAGTTTAYGYRVVRASGKTYRVHHIVWLMHHGYLPSELDHINNKPADNRIENLRECTHQQNGVNRLKGRNNTSGYKGVRFVKLSNDWIAVTEYQVDGKRGFRLLGHFQSAEMAAVAYNLDVMRHYPEFGHPNKIPGPLGQIFGMA